MLLLATALLLAAPGPAPATTTLATRTPAARPFVVTSADGTAIHGQVDLPGAKPKVVAVMVAGTGLFDRDARFGRSNTDRDALFKDLAGRLIPLGVASVRYDRRGVVHTTDPAKRLNRPVAGTSTVETQRDDLAAVYAWARSQSGLGARCIVLVGHSEGVAHIAKLAQSGAPPPQLVLGIGAALESPVAIVRWQMTGRDADSLRLMDANGDGRTTNAEAEANWRKTPSSAFDLLDPFKHPSGAWTQADIAEVTVKQAAIYETQKKAALAVADTAPFPNTATPMARYSWWKSWFLDDTPLAARLASWRVPVSLHYGAFDSQTPATRNVSAARAALGDRVRTVVHAGRGHSLGEHALFGPMDEALADGIAKEIAAVAGTCR